MLHKWSFEEQPLTILAHDGPVFVTLPLAEKEGQIDRIRNSPDSLAPLIVKTDRGEVEIQVGEERAFTTIISRANRFWGRWIGQKTKLLWVLAP